MVADEKQAIEILKKYLPDELSNDELKKIIDQVILQTGAKNQQDIGKVMGVIMGQTKGRADGNLVVSLVKEKLAD